MDRTAKESKDDAQILALHELSAKGFSAAKFSPSLKTEPDFRPAIRGEITCTSGKLVFCDGVSAESGTLLNGINLNSLQLPNFLLGNDIVAFRNQWGDGVFDVYRRGANLFVATNAPLENASGIKGNASEFKRQGWGYPSNYLEGVVGIGSGVMAVFDPTIYHLTDEPDLAALKRYGEFFTVVDVMPGRYECGYVRNCARFRLRRLGSTEGKQPS